MSDVVDLSGAAAPAPTPIVDLSGAAHAPAPAPIIDLSGAAAPAPAPAPTPTPIVDISNNSFLITPETLLTPPPQVISLDDLMNEQTVVLAKESTDRNAVAAFINPSAASLKPALYRWAAAGFPGAYIVDTLALTPPPVCSDGMSRSLAIYMEFLMGKSISAWLSSLEAMTSGMLFTFSHDGNTRVVLHVSKL